MLDSKNACVHASLSKLSTAVCQQVLDGKNACVQLLLQVGAAMNNSIWLVMSCFIMCIIILGT